MTKILLVINAFGEALVITQGRATLRVRFELPMTLTAPKHREFIEHPTPLNQAPHRPVRPEPLAPGDYGVDNQVHARFSAPSLCAKIVLVTAIVSPKVLRSFIQQCFDSPSINFFHL